MKKKLGFGLLILWAAMIMPGCSTAPKTAAGKADLHRAVLNTVERFKTEDPGIVEFFNNAYGYAVFPSVGKGGIGIGGAYGRGELFDSGALIGNCSLSQATIGFQLGGQTYSEVIFFDTRNSLDNFINGTLEFSAQVSVVALTAGASADADYEYGVSVFTMPNKGLMYEASIGGQKFSYVPN